MPLAPETEVEQKLLLVITVENVIEFDFSSRIQLKNDRSAEVLYTGDI